MIRGSHTSLRPMTPDDIDMFVRWVNDPAVSSFWYGKNRPVTREDLLDDWKDFYFDGSAPEKGRCFIIEVESSPVGLIAYTDVSYDIDKKPVRADMDIVIGEARNQGRGYGTDAMRAFLSYLFGELGFHRVDAHTYEYNTRMQYCLEKVGFQFEGVSRQAAWIDGRFVDEMSYGMLAGEFKPER